MATTAFSRGRDKSYDVISVQIVEFQNLHFSILNIDYCLNYWYQNYEKIQSY